MFFFVGLLFHSNLEPATFNIKSSDLIFDKDHFCKMIFLYLYFFD